MNEELDFDTILENEKEEGGKEVIYVTITDFLRLKIVENGLNHVLERKYKNERGEDAWQVEGYYGRTNTGEWVNLALELITQYKMFKTNKQNIMTLKEYIELRKQETKTVMDCFKTIR